jgi:hypothetical protein
VVSQNLTGSGFWTTNERDRPIMTSPFDSTTPLLSRFVVDNFCPSLSVQVTRHFRFGLKVPLGYTFGALWISDP